MPVSSCTHTPTTLPSTQAVVPALPTLSKSTGPCAPRKKSRPFQPITVGSRSGSSAAHGSGDATGSTSSSRSHASVPSSSATGRAPRSSSAVRTAVLVPPSHQAMSSTVPGPYDHSHRFTSSAYPASASSRSGTTPSHQTPVVVHVGRLAYQGPAFAPRATAPAMLSWASTFGAIAIFPPHDAPGACSIIPPTSGTCARTCAEVRGTPSERCASTARSASASHASPVPPAAGPQRSRFRIRRRRCDAAMRAAALPQTAGTRSRGSTNSVSRIACCRIRERAS